MGQRRVATILVIAALIGLGYFGYTRYLTPEPEATPEPVIAEEIVEVVSASGEVLPAKWAELALETSGRVEEVAVEVGDEVTAGQLLARLDATDLEHAEAQAEATLAMSKAQLKQLEKGARAEDIAGAQANLDAARANLTTAKAGLTSAQANLDKLLAGPTEHELKLAELDIEQAKNALWGVQGQRDAIRGSSLSKPGEKDAAEASVGQAHVAVQMAQTQLEQLKAGPTEEDIAIAQAQIDQARGQVEGAQAQVHQAQATLDKLKAGATSEELAIARAKVDQTKAALAQAQAALNDACLTAPFAGTVTRVDLREGEMVAAGQPVITMGDLSHLRVETTDLSEMDVTKVKIGQKVDLTFDALPEKKLTGRVTKIYPMATLKEGGTNYTVTIEFEETDPRLRWGMTAFVDIIIGD